MSCPIVQYNYPQGTPSAGGTTPAFVIAGCPASNKWIGKLVSDSTWTPLNPSGQTQVGQLTVDFTKTISGPTGAYVCSSGQGAPCVSVVDQLPPATLPPQAPWNAASLQEAMQKLKLSSVLPEMLNRFGSACCGPLTTKGPCPVTVKPFGPGPNQQIAYQLLLLQSIQNASDPSLTVQGFLCFTPWGGTDYFVKAPYSNSNISLPLYDKNQQQNGTVTFDFNGSSFVASGAAVSNPATTIVLPPPTTVNYPDYFSSGLPVEQGAYVCCTGSSSSGVQSALYAAQKAASMLFPSVDAKTKNIVYAITVLILFSVAFTLTARGLLRVYRSSK